MERIRNDCLGDNTLKGKVLPSKQINSLLGHWAGSTYRSNQFVKPINQGLVLVAARQRNHFVADVFLKRIAILIKNLTYFEDLEKI